MGDLDDVRKVANGTGPRKVTHILCLCPEHLRDDDRDLWMLSLPRIAEQGGILFAHIKSECAVVFHERLRM